MDSNGNVWYNKRESRGVLAGAHDELLQPLFQDFLKQLKPRPGSTHPRPPRRAIELERGDAFLLDRVLAQRRSDRGLRAFGPEGIAVPLNMHYTKFDPAHYLRVGAALTPHDTDTLWDFGDYTDWTFLYIVKDKYICEICGQFKKWLDPVTNLTHCGNAKNKGKCLHANEAERQRFDLSDEDLEEINATGWGETDHLEDDETWS
jgi:hypothetical protein